MKIRNGRTLRRYPTFDEISTALDHFRRALPRVYGAPISGEGGVVYEVHVSSPGRVLLATLKLDDGRVTRNRGSGAWHQNSAYGRDHAAVWLHEWGDLLRSKYVAR